MTQHSPVKTYEVSIRMAGDIEVAKQAIRKYCYYNGLCVTIVPADFIYTGGEETGFMVGLANYPRFPAPEEEILNTAYNLANMLIKECCQKTALLVASNITELISADPPGRRT